MTARDDALLLLAGVTIGGAAVVGAWPVVLLGVALAAGTITAREWRLRRPRRR